MNFAQNLKKYFLKPAELCFVNEPAIIQTVLGSCVSVTMYHEHTHTGVMCHPVLPLCREAGACKSSLCRDKYKYVECVIPEMITRFQKIGVSPKELEIKLFGGAHMFHKSPNSKKIQHVGTMNISMAKHMIETLNIKLKSIDVGGTHGRKIIFNSDTGDVWLKKIKHDSADLAVKQALSKQIQLQLNR